MESDALVWKDFPLPLVLVAGVVLLCVVLVVPFLTARDLFPVPYSAAWTARLCSKVKSSEYRSTQSRNLVGVVLLLATVVGHTAPGKWGMRDVNLAGQYVSQHVILERDPMG